MVQPDHAVPPLASRLAGLGSTVLGVDGGGSHTHVVVADERGRVLGMGISRDPSNWEDVGIEAAGAAVRSCARSALAQAGVAAADVTASVFGLAGVDFPLDADRLAGIPESLGVGHPTRVVNDSLIALRAGTDLRYGVVIVSGTGAIVAGRNRAGQEFRTLGQGPSFGDWGSASEVSEAGITAVAEAFVGLGPPTALTGLMVEAAGEASVVGFLEGVARGRLDRAAYATVVSRATEAGDAIAASIYERAGRSLGANAAHAVRALGMEAESFDLVLSGGTIRGGGERITRAISEAVLAVAPNARPTVLEAPPVVGAVLLALELAGEPAAPATRLALAEGLRSLMPAYAA
jgi:N-acetylglucosamine kinase-like BadF-type ATPase